MGKVRKFSVILTSDVLNLNGELVAYLRTPENYQLKRNQKKELPEISYEVDVEILLPQFGIQGKVSDEAMHKHHLSPGKDGKIYMCAFLITENNLVSTAKLWLAHQVLVEKFGIDIMTVLTDFYSNKAFSGTDKFSQKAETLRQKDSSINFTDIVLCVCEAAVKIEEI